MARYGDIVLVTLDENNELEGDALKHVERVAAEAAATAAASKLDATAFADYVAQAQARGVTAPVENRSASLNAVTEFNADPTGSVDSTAAINRAIQQAAERGGGTVHLPAGTYKVSYPFIELLGSVHLQGAGRESTTLFVDTAVPVPVKTAVIHAGNYDEPRRGTGNILMGVSDLFIKSEYPLREHTTNIPANVGGIVFHTELGVNPHEPDGAHRIENVLIWDMAYGIALFGLDDQACQVRNVRVRRTREFGVCVGKPLEHSRAKVDGKRETGAGDNILDAVDVSGANISGEGFAGIECYTTNTTFTACKAWYNRRSSSGVEGAKGSIWDTKGSNAEHPHAPIKNGTGFYVHGGRNIFTGCTAQENGGHGFAVVGTANQVVGCRAASSSWWDTSNKAPNSAADFFIANWAWGLVMSGNIAQSEYGDKTGAKYGYFFEAWGHDITATGNAAIAQPIALKTGQMGKNVSIEVNQEAVKGA